MNYTKSTGKLTVQISIQFIIQINRIQEEKPIAVYKQCWVKYYFLKVFRVQV